jgi:hypothetical protein
MLPRASLAFRASVAMAGGLTSVALLGAVVLGLTSMADGPTGGSTIATTPLVDPDTATKTEQEAMAASPVCPIDRARNPDRGPATQGRSPDDAPSSLALCRSH